MSGGSWEYVAGVLDSKLSNDSYYDFTEIDSKYYDTYTSYNESKKIKGDGVYETSRRAYQRVGKGYGWHDDLSYFPESSHPVFQRGR